MTLTQAGRMGSRPWTYATIAAAMVSWLTPFPMTLRGIAKAFELAGIMSIQIIAVCACAGIIVGVISLTGVGAAMAWGWRFLDDRGNDVGLGGAALSRIRHVEPPENLALPLIEVLCDVDNPLCGPRGAARVYGPQKGADEKMVALLDRNLEHFAELIRDQLGKEVAGIPGAVSTIPCASLVRPFAY